MLRNALFLSLPFIAHAAFLTPWYTRDPDHSRQVEQRLHPNQPEVSKKKNFTQMFLECNIVPHIIDKPPKHLCQVIYTIDQFDEPYPIRTAERMRDYETKKPPLLKFPTRENKFYTMYMVGFTPWNHEEYWVGDFDEEKHNPQHPTREPPKIQQWEQWIKINIPAHNTSGGEEILKYLPPRIGDANVTEYYAVLIYEQPEKMLMGSDEWKDHLGHNFHMFHTLRHFANKYRLGDPWAGNFFHTFMRTEAPFDP